MVEIGYKSNLIQNLKMDEEESKISIINDKIFLGVKIKQLTINLIKF